MTGREYLATMNEDELTRYGHDWTDADRLADQETIARIDQQDWQEVCSECHVHKGHRASCKKGRGLVNNEIPADLSLKAYRDFIKRKCRLSQEFGVPVQPGEIGPYLKSHQRAAVEWAVRGGRRALFESFGLGKTRQQLEILRLILAKVGGRGLIVAPLGVRLEFFKEAEVMGVPLVFVRSIEECDGTGIYLTNYETVRDGKLDPNEFTCASLDEASVLRGFGGTKTFREFMRLFENVPYRFVATATPSPNDYIELLAYAAFLGISDVSGAKTRFFKRDSTKADNLTIHPHKVQEFWMWVHSWALFLYKPSDMGPEHSDLGYDLPPMNVVYHEIAVDHSLGATPERDGQGRFFREAAHGVVDAAREKRETLKERIAKAAEIIEENPKSKHWLLWHDLEDERREISRVIGNAVSVWGTQQMNERENALMDFAEGRIPILSTKPEIAGSGSNFQRHCSDAIFCGIGFKFNDFIQAIHRIYRFGQTEPVTIHIIYAESEKRILANLLDKWERHKEQSEKMCEIMREYGLSTAAMEDGLARGLGVERKAQVSAHCTFVHNDCVEELHGEAGIMPDNSVGLILTSIPFSTQYEYSPNFNDFGHTDGNDHFWRQMDFLIPQLLRVLKPGRICAIHVKDRIVPGGVSGRGYGTAYPLHAHTIFAFEKHGFGYMGMKTIVTDVVRENNQTYRLGWTEQCKDGSKMGVGMPEYLLLFRKDPTDAINAYADEPVVKDKAEYSRSRWQIDAHGFARSSGNRLLASEDLENLDHGQIFRLFRKFSYSQVYNFENHVALGEALEAKKILPVTFMLLQPQSWHPDVWTEITRMRTLNMTQAQKGKEQHLCPMQEDLAKRVIAQMSSPGDVVLDPFGGIGSVPYWAVKGGRIGYGCELSEKYFDDGAFYCDQAEKEISMPTLFDLLETESEEDAVPIE